MSFSIFPPDFTGSTASLGGRRGLVPTPALGQQAYVLLGSGSFSSTIDGLTVTGLAMPTGGTDAAPKSYVDAVATGLSPKASVRVSTTGAITLSGAQTIDGVSVIAGDRVLVKNQVATETNGIYVCAAGAWSRSTDADASSEVVSGMYVFTNAGTTNANIAFILTTADPITLGTTGLSFSAFSSLGGAFVANDGTAALPSFTFQTDLDTGMFRSSANLLSFATAGQDQWDITSTGVLSSPSTGRGWISAGNGTAGLPAYNFVGDSDTGFYSTGAGQIGVSLDGTARLIFNYTSATPFIQGSAGGQSIQWDSTGGFTVTASGTNQSITLTPSGTGALSVSVSGLTNPVKIGQISTGTTYGALTFNNTFTSTGILGLAAGGGSDTNLYVNVPTNGIIKFQVNNAVKGQFATSGNLLLGGLTTDGTGVLQLPAATTSAGGITFGTEINAYREATGRFTFGGALASGSMAIYADNTSATGTTFSGFFARGNGAEVVALIATITGGTATSGQLASRGAYPLNLAYNNTDVLSLTSATNARIIGTKTLSFGATANATIGVSADTTAGVLTFTAPSATGNVLFSLAGAADSYIGITGASSRAHNFGVDATSAYLYASGDFRLRTNANANTPITTSGNNVTVAGKVTSYNAIATAGWGFSTVQADGAIAATTNARSAAVATYTVGGTDGTFIVSANVNVTTSTAHSFSIDCVYTDETNTSRTLVMPVAQLAGGFVATGLITQVTGAGPYESAAMTIRCKASTSITIRPSAGGTYTTVVYNVAANIRQVG